MDTREINGSASAARSISLLKQPDYSSKPVQEALKHLASVNLRELCNEAKIDPVIAFLLDEVVVKDWVKCTFRSILSELQEIYSLETKEMQVWLDKLQKCSKQVAGICSVLEVMESAL